MHFCTFVWTLPSTCGFPSIDKLKDYPALFTRETNKKKKVLKSATDKIIFFTRKGNGNMCDVSFSRVH